MFDRFTDRARNVMIRARTQAQQLGHDAIRPEHFLLALMEVDGVAAQVLTEIGVTAEGALREVRRRGMGQRERASAVGETSETSARVVPFTPEAKRVLTAAVGSAQVLSQEYIGTEHVLLGLVTVEGHAAVEVLRALGVEPARVKRNTLALLGCDEDVLDDPNKALSNVLARAVQTPTRSIDVKTFAALVDLSSRELMPVLVRHASPSQRRAFVEKAHALGRLAAKPLVVLDCARLSDAELERDLFSLVVADPPSSKPQPLGGSSTPAEGGTLFLDCIDSLGKPLQERLAALFKTIPHSWGSPFALGRQPRERLRIMAGTSLDLGVLASEGDFDLDLFRRLSQVTIVVPDDFEARLAESLADPSRTVEASTIKLGLTEAMRLALQKIKLVRPPDTSAVLVKALAPSAIPVLVRGPSSAARLAVVQKMHGKVPGVRHRSWCSDAPWTACWKPSSSGS